MRHEIEFQSRLWQGDFEAALESSERVLGGLAAPELQGYRALWHYLAGSAAWAGAEQGITGLAAKARIHFGQAKEAARSIPWLVALARFQPDQPTAARDNAAVLRQIERTEGVLSRLGTVHDRAYSRREREILEGLTDADRFEQAQVKLGELLGFDVGKVETDASPDPWWISEGICFVFEDHAGAGTESVLDATKARQAASHPAWMTANVPACTGAQILPVLVTPVTRAKESALPHLTNVALWPVHEFQVWAQAALVAVRDLRRTFVEPGDLVWRAHAAEIFETNGLDAPSLHARLRARTAATGLKGVK